MAKGAKRDTVYQFGPCSKINEERGLRVSNPLVCSRIIAARAMSKAKPLLARP